MLPVILEKVNGIWEPRPVLTKYRGVPRGFFDLQRFAGTPWYVDNTVAVSGDGTSWANAWKNLSNIAWTSVSAGDAIYISGGSSSKTYYELFSVQKSGTSGNIITVDKGANSPYPSGHSGTVIIDGNGSRQGINTGSRNYWTIKNLNIQNCLRNVYIGYCNYATLDGLTITNNNGEGIFWQGCNYGLVKNNFIDTGTGSTTATVDGFFVQWGDYNIFENNHVILRITLNSASHTDCFQVNQEHHLTARNNIFDWNGAANSTSQVTMITQNYGWFKFYNNICIGNTTKADQVVFFGDSSATWEAIYYFWNNTIMARATNGAALHWYSNTTDAYIGEIINNILIGGPGGGYCYYGESTPSTSKIRNNELWEYGYAPGVAHLPAGAYSWSAWQSAGYDANGVHANPSLDADLKPDSETDPSVGTGEDLSAYFTTDKDGKTRSAWDIGAYEYGEGPSGLSPNIYDTIKARDSNEPRVASYAIQFAKVGS